MQFFSKGGLLGVLFYPKGVILQFPNVTRIFLKEYILEDPLGQNANFFQKGGFWRAILSKSSHFAISKCDPHFFQNLWEAYLLSQKQNFGLKMMPRVSP